MTCFDMKTEELSSIEQAVKSSAAPAEIVAAFNEWSALRERLRNSASRTVASAWEMDILLSWDCRHLANAAMQARLRRLADAAGFTLPVICTPEELMDNDHEQND